MGVRKYLRHEMVDHTSEVTLRLFAPTFEALLGEATRAFGRLVPTSLRSGEASTSDEFRVAGADHAALLVGWLNEIVYLVDANAWLAEEVEWAREDGDEIVIRAHGVPLREPFALVKAATLHGATVRATPSGMEAEVTLDV